MKIWVWGKKLKKKKLQNIFAETNLEKKKMFWNFSPQNIFGCSQTIYPPLVQTRNFSPTIWQIWNDYALLFPIFFRLYENY